MQFFGLTLGSEVERVQFAYVLSWPYSEPGDARLNAGLAFAAITLGIEKEGTSPFPYGGCEIALIVDGPQDMVVISGEGAPPETLVHDMGAWLRQFDGIKQPNAAETHSFDGPLSEVVRARGWGRVADSARWP